jgi:threonine aldolase
MDLRSDMLGRRPSRVIAAMSAAANASSMDDEDPHKRALEERVATLLGCEDALFLPTCTMANQIVVRHLSRSGTTIIADKTSHLVQRELSAATTYHEAHIHALEAPKGHLPPSLVREAVRTIGRSAVWLEDTHNAAGGVVMPEGWLHEIVAIAGASSVFVHIDGARLWNASVASGRSLSELAAGADTVALSLNKCLDAPLGGVLAGTASLIELARAARTDLGGRWRPVGQLAAAASAALDDFPERIADVHRRAQRFHAKLAEAAPALAGSAPETNVLMLQFGDDETAERFLARLRALGVDALPYGAGRIRFVMHSGIHEEDLDYAAERIGQAAEDVQTGR